MQIPENIVIEAHIHVTNDEGLDAAMKLSGNGHADFSEAEWPKLTQIACDRLNKFTGSTSARPMTLEEVKAFRAKESEDALEGEEGDNAVKNLVAAAREDGDDCDEDGRNG